MAKSKKPFRSGAAKAAPPSDTKSGYRAPKSRLTVTGYTITERGRVALEHSTANAVAYALRSSWKYHG